MTCHEFDERQCFSYVTDTEPTERDLRLLVAEKVADSHGLGTMLNMEHSQIEKFVSEERKTVLVNMKILTTWKESGTKRPTTWRTLLKALRDIQRNKLAGDITKELEQRSQ